MENQIKIPIPGQGSEIDPLIPAADAVMNIINHNRQQNKINHQQIDWLLINRHKIDQLTTRLLAEVIDNHVIQHFQIYPDQPYYFWLFKPFWCCSSHYKNALEIVRQVTNYPINDLNCTDCERNQCSAVWCGNFYDRFQTKIIYNIYGNPVIVNPTIYISYRYPCLPIYYSKYLLNTYSYTLISFIMSILLFLLLLFIILIQNQMSSYSWLWISIIPITIWFIRNTIRSTCCMFYVIHPYSFKI